VLLSLLEELELQREESVTKKEFNELKEIVRDLGKIVKELAEAQKKTEKEIAKLVKRMDAFEERLEGLSNSVGYTLENAAYKGLPKLLAERCGLKVEDRLIRRYLTVGQKDIQINIYGYARKNGKRLLILGECKVRPSKREIEQFEKYARWIAEQEGTEVFLVFVAHDFPPKIEKLLQEKGIMYFWSYELE
jgi:hypothetical protein